MTTADAPPRNTRPRNRKELIVAAAAELFSTRGYPHVAMSHIAEAVAVGPSALYRHFPGKQELLAAVLADRVETFESRVRQAHGSPDATTVLASAALAHRDFGVLWDRESRHLEGAARRRLGTGLGAIVEELRKLVADRRGDLEPDDVDAVAWLTVGVLVSPSFHRVTLPGDGLVGLVAEMTGAVLEIDWPPSDRSPAAAKHVAARSRREQLLNEAITLFAEHGYQAVGIEDIGAAAGLTGASIYRHFETKNEILTSAMTRGAEWLRFDLNRALAEGGTPPELLRALVGSYVSLVLDHTDLISVLLTETGHLPEQDQRRIRQEQREYVAEWRRLLAVVHPEESDEIARCRAQAAFTVANTAARNRSLRGRTDLDVRIRAACAAVLSVKPDSGDVGDAGRPR